VLGGGTCGQMFAADLSLAGWEVRLYELLEFRKGIENIIDGKRIEIVGDQLNSKEFKRAGVADIDVVTTNIEEALAGH
jgi:opine dehydrogenase